MAKFEHNGKVYRPECIKCGSGNVTLVENSKGAQFRCNKCKTKTRFYATRDRLLEQPGMFKPNPIMDVRVDEDVREEHALASGRLTEKDVELLEEIKEARGGCPDSAVWTLYEERWEPCWEELAEKWELYDPVTKQTIAYVGDKMEDVGRLKCIPVKLSDAGMTSSTFISSAEAENMAAALDGVRVREDRLLADDLLRRLLGVVQRVDWEEVAHGK